jgi:hypothetical protein
MRTTAILLAVLMIAGSAAAQRRARIGPTVSLISLDDESGGSSSFSSFGGSFAFLSGDDGELGLAVSRYGDLSSGSCARRMTFFGVESNYYPVGPKGVAPFASTSLGLARVLDENPQLLPLGCASGAATTSEIGLGFGLGVRLNVGRQAVAMVEGRFFQVPNSAIQALEGRANLSLAFGSPRQTQLLNGTLGPSIGMLLPLNGVLEGRGPAFGIRFRRDTKKAGSVAGLQIDYVPLRVKAGCSGSCEPYAILFAPGFEPSLRPAWGRLYFDLGLLLAGFPQRTADRGLAQGAHAGIGADIVTGHFPMWNLNARALWLQRSTSTDRNAFLLQFGVSVSPPIESR